jgi:quercetin dioxygenase-like cupin family protein
MSDKPYMIYPSTATTHGESGAKVTSKLFINEPGKVCYGTADFIPGWSVALHTHNTWEIIIVGGESEGPGYVFFDDQWWRADPGSALFVPKGFVHAWSAGNHNGFKMLWIYKGSVEEAGRNWVEDYRPAPLISPEEEEKASVWAPEAWEKAAQKSRH